MQNRAKLGWSGSVVTFVETAVAPQPAKSSFRPCWCWRRRR